jgi:preprotein translocase subunit SecD
MIQLLRETMLVRASRFNTILGLVLFASIGMGCQSAKKKKEASIIRFHLETNRDGTERNFPVSIGKDKIFSVQIEKQPFLDEGHVQKATVVEDIGGFQVEIQFDRHGTWVLEQYTTANKGRRVAIYSQFGQERWLGAPVIRQRVADGKYAFTPDATREEADRLVRGLNKVANKLDEGRQ